MDERQIAGEIRNDKGQFLPGVSGNPAGKPPGTVSIVAKIKKRFEENPEYFDEWVATLMADPKLRKDIMEQLDGKPKQAMEVSGKDGAPIAIEISEAIARKNEIDV
jgi:hypothetical protein